MKLYLANPRGFCAGVDRAIQIVELALEKYGAPVYVRHAIVHNRYVVDTLKAKGAIFVEELDEIPDTDAPIVFSAHGVPKAVPAEARRRRLLYADATCPLVRKVHRGVEQHHRRGDTQARPDQCATPVDGEQPPRRQSKRPGKPPRPHRRHAASFS